MLWLAPSEKDRPSVALDKRLWAAAVAHASRPELIQTLGRTRDLLLPRLLSGQVELKTQGA